MPQQLRSAPAPIQDSVSKLSASCQHRGSNAEPPQPARKFTHGEIDLQDPALCRFKSRLRAVEDRCRVEPDIASIGQAFDSSASSHDVRHLGFGNSPEPMRSRRNKQWCICCWYRIKVDTKRHHTSQKIERRRNMQHTVLDGPRTKTIDFDTLANRYGAILMPAKRPVCGSRLIEQEPSYGSAFRTQHGCGDRAHWTCGSEEGSKSSDAEKSDPGVPRSQTDERILDLPQCGFAYGRMQALCAIARKRHCARIRKVDARCRSNFSCRHGSCRLRAGTSAKVTDDASRGFLRCL